MAADAPDRDGLVDVARDAYEFFFPMLMGYRFMFGSFLATELPSYLRPPNTIGGEPKTLDHTFRDVITPNADTPYSFAGLDLRAEPMVLSVPAVADRFYHFQMEDLWGHNVHYVGTRTTGTGPGVYMLAGPGWSGDAPQEVDEVFRFETDVVFIIGRTQLLGTGDVDALGQIMASYDLQPLSSFLGTPAPHVEPYDWPKWNDEASRDERFIGYVNALLPLCRPFHPEDVPHLERFAAIGIGSGEPFDADALEDKVRAAIEAGVEKARAEMADKGMKIMGRTVNGWLMVEAFGNRASYDGNHLLRAAGAMGGWGGNDLLEAAYPSAHVDADGEPLHGDHQYRLTLASPPPAEAFWSFTMYDRSYDGTAGYLVENPIDRYLINSTTDGLVRGDDGSLTLYIQHDEPDTPEGRANWLPAPAAPFYIALRIYLPGQSFIDGDWEPPPIERVS